MQLHNIKLQQALIGLNARQSAAGGDAGAVGGKLRDLRNRPELNYTQQDAKDILDNNSADDNAAFIRLAEKLIQQQDAAVSHPRRHPRQHSRARPRAHLPARRGRGAADRFAHWAERFDWGGRLPGDPAADSVRHAAGLRPFRPGPALLADERGRAGGLIRGPDVLQRRAYGSKSCRVEPVARPRRTAPTLQQLHSNQELNHGFTRMDTDKERLSIRVHPRSSVVKSSR